MALVVSGVAMLTVSFPVVAGVVIVCTVELELVGEEAMAVDDVSACVVVPEVIFIDATVLVAVLVSDPLEVIVVRAVGVEVDLAAVSIGVVNSVV